MLQITGGTLVLGTVLAIISVPGALFILIGGALVNRHSSKPVLMITQYVNLALLAALAGSVAQGLNHSWRDSELRTCFLYWSAIALSIKEPIHITIQVLASSTSSWVRPRSALWWARMVQVRCWAWGCRA